jgi:UDP-N-acetylglucosamine 4,6-dehydratase
MFKVLIIGGTGTIGTSLVERHYEHWNISVLARDEYKHAVLRQRFPYIGNIVGDIRDRDVVRRALKIWKWDHIVFAAAMKRVEICEAYPVEAVKTNIMGLNNVVEECQEEGLRLTCITTDKGVEPVNVYGMTKAIQERIVLAAGYKCVRYGNVFGSRGSVVPLFQKQVEQGVPITITDEDMTRFILPKSAALNLIETAMVSEKLGPMIFVGKSPSAKVTDIAQAIGGEGYPIEVIGRGQGEKVHECLISSEETPYTSLYNEHVVTIDRHFGDSYLDAPYTSDTNTEWLTVEDIVELLNGEPL